VLLERLLDNLAVEVEPFAVCEISDGWRLRLDGAGFVMLHYVLEGEGSLLIPDGTRLQLGTYALAVVPPGIAHSIETGEAIVDETTTAESRSERGGLEEFVAGPRSEDDLIVACGRLKVTYGGGVGLFDLLREALVIDFSDSDPMRETFERLLEEERSAGPGMRAMMTALMSQCLVLMLRRVCEDPEAELPWLEALDDPRLASVIDTILEHPEQPHSLDSLAAESYMSRSAFVSQFTSHFGRTPMAFVREVRMRRAADLLRGSTLSVDDVASRVGYASRSQFSHAFKEQYKCSPAKYRAELN
jgi:AraC-like DNA-binding protein